MPEHTRCRSCQAPIEFRRNAAGRLEPISRQTGESHFIDCPQRREWRKAPGPTQGSFFAEGEVPVVLPESRRPWEV